MSSRARIAIMGWILFLGSSLREAPAAPSTIYDEAKVPSYTLPDPLVSSNGEKVEDAEAWRAKRRPEILRLFQEHVYGKAPGRPADMTFEVTSTKPGMLEGKASRKLVTVRLSKDRNAPTLDLLIYLPKKTDKPVPVFLGLNFWGNHSVLKDPSIPLSTRWFRNRKSIQVTEHRATEATRGLSEKTWPVERILARGYGLVTAYYGDLEADHAEGWKTGIRAALGAKGDRTVFAPGDWGAIGAWAWALSRAMDYIETDEAIDAKRVAVMGHSRLGKTALWAGAQDERFALVISVQSGCGGAALSRRRFGETVRRINTIFPHWFCGRFKTYNDREDDLPVDQHMLIALSAPRPILVCSAEADRWADPRGEFLAAKHAAPVYRLLGTEGLSAAEWPSPPALVKSTIGYYYRPGKHSVTPEDWDAFMDFADRHLVGRSSR